MNEPAKQKLTKKPSLNPQETESLNIEEEQQPCVVCGKLTSRKQFILVDHVCSEACSSKLDMEDGERTLTQLIKRLLKKEIKREARKKVNASHVRLENLASEGGVR